MIWQYIVGGGTLILGAAGLAFAICRYCVDRMDKFEARLDKRMDQVTAEILKRIDKSDERNEKQFESVNEQLRDLNRRTGVLEGAVIGVQIGQERPRTLAAQSVPDPKDPSQPKK